MKRNILLSGIMVGLVVSPTIALVSCSSATQPVDEVLKILSKGVLQEVINTAITNYKSSTNDQDRIGALNTVFDGILIKDLINMTVSIEETAPKSITLIAKDGFVFSNGTKELVTTSNDEILNIVSKGVLQEVINTAITNYKSSTNDQDRIGALNTVFDGILIKDLINMTVSIEETAPKSITLIAKDGFVFSNGTKELVTTSNGIYPKVALEFENFLKSYLPSKTTTEEEVAIEMNRTWRDAPISQIINFYNDKNIKLNDKELESLNIEITIGLQFRWPTNSRLNPSMASVAGAINNDKYNLDRSSFTTFRHDTDWNNFVTDKNNFGKTFIINTKYSFNDKPVNGYAPWLTRDFAIIMLYDNLVLETLNITSKSVSQEIINIAIADYKSSRTDQDKIDALNTVFDGIAIKDLAGNITISINDTEPKSITLTANESWGIIFSDGTREIVTTPI